MADCVMRASTHPSLISCSDTIVKGRLNSKYCTAPSTLVRIHPVKGVVVYNFWCIEWLWEKICMVFGDLCDLNLIAVCFVIPVLIAKTYL